ncbi:hypothetical protein BW13_00785 [Bifidobacterium sp. UTCIF-37]|uniref:YqaJ viral recombinase family nuclease n=1 Tax=unclassified Bifidobacterium TaxID=2608897 RepID=UPI0015E37008|nr:MULTISPECIES: YqaJ viral recombinase family protein [unclassified Bifidobacterium]TPF87421.1 hypothetical protein BW13_00785 [Bifidobacterium sp. UTCIF-37]TPF91197.1 hypothetical protein BW11_00785 [Bifidobacterium sp. UTCIF-38]
MSGKVTRSNLIARAQQRSKDTGNAFNVHRFRGNGTTKAGREAAWHAFRDKGVGGSDMSTILGLNQWASPYDLWLEKTGRQAPEDISGKWAIVKGNALEVELRRRFRTLHPELITVDGTDISIAAAAHPCMHASLDGWLYDPESDSFGVLEIKTANAIRGRNDWHGEDGILCIPDYYMAQVTHYLAVTGFDWGYVYADIGESEPVEIRFERDEEDVEAVTRKAEEFWGFVQRDEMPALTGADVDKAQSTQPYPEGYEQVEDSEFDDLAGMYDTYAQTESNARKAKEKIAAQLKAMVGADREGLISGGWKVGYRTIHYKSKPAVEAKPAYDQRRFTITKLNTKKEN